MLQRIQTVFLILLVIIMIISLFLPVWHFGVNGQEVYVLTPFGLTNLQPTADQASYTSVPYFLVAILAIASVTVAILEIFKFNNRLLQMKLGALNSLLLAGSMVLGVYFANNLTGDLELPGKYGWFVFFPPAAMIMNLLANRFIRRDEKLVRSVDRIR